jgi:uncharacterized protein (TIGR03032 family)
MSQAETPVSSAPTSLRTLYTDLFPTLLAEQRISIFASTFQWEKLLILQHDPEEGVDTQFRQFFKPMALTVRKDRLVVSTQGIIQEYRNVPSVAAQINVTRPCDAAYLPRTIHATGEISAHEMDWGGPDRDELWFVNTRFSCLCTRDQDYSFIPKWRPKFITDLTGDDRCHLNGFCMIDGQSAYATALGETDTAGGWRVNKKSGGILIDVRSNEIVCRELSMPHSPRWYQGKLWVLQAGSGELGIVDPDTGRFEKVAAVPGFARGLDFHGPYAFIGLSLVRDLAIYNGLPITQMPAEKRATGIWVVDIRSGKVVAFIKFVGDLREVFAVAVLPDYQHPDVINSDVAILKDTFTFPPGLDFRYDPASARPLAAAS